MFYYYKKSEILKGKLFLLGIENKKLTEEEIESQNKTELYKDTIIYEAENSFVGYPIFEENTNTIRSATRLELINLGLEELNAGEYIDKDKIVTVEAPINSWQYEWDKVIHKWVPQEERLQSGEYIENNIIITIPYDLALGYIKPVWDKATHTWREGATDLDRVMAQYNEYSSMDTPSTLKEMQMQDPTLAEELVNMLIELRGMIYSLQTPTKSRGFSQLHIPTPSQNLINFKNKFNLIK